MLGVENEEGESGIYWKGVSYYIVSYIDSVIAVKIERQTLTSISQVLQKHEFGYFRQLSQSPQTKKKYDPDN